MTMTGRGSEVLRKRQFLWIHMRVWEMDRAEQAYSAATEEDEDGGLWEDSSIQIHGLSSSRLDSRQGGDS